VAYIQKFNVWSVATLAFLLTLFPWNHSSVTLHIYSYSVFRVLSLRTSLNFTVEMQFLFWQTAFYIARTVGLLISMQCQSVSLRNVLATMEIIQYVIVSSATISDIIIDGVETTLYTLAYPSSGIWMQKCRHIWWNQLSGTASRIIQSLVYV
jgi:hypothetical protein